MSLRREFELWMDREYKQWRRSRVVDSVLAWNAFRAGYGIGENGPTLEGLNVDPGKPQNVFKAAVGADRQFDPNRRLKRK